MPTGFSIELNGVTINGVTYYGAVDLDLVFHERGSRPATPNVICTTSDGRDLSDWFAPLSSGSALEVDCGISSEGVDFRQIWAKRGTVSGTGPGGGCLPFDTPVVLWATGSKPLGELRPGDVVTGYYRDGMLDESFENWRDWEMPIAAATGGVIIPVTVRCAMIGEYSSHYMFNGCLRATYEHPFMILRDGVWQWVQAKNVVVGDSFFSDSFDQVKIQSIEFIQAPMVFANIDVEEIDNFFIVSLGATILTHNDNKT